MWWWAGASGREGGSGRERAGSTTSRFLTKRSSQTAVQRKKKHTAVHILKKRLEYFALPHQEVLSYCSAKKKNWHTNLLHTHSYTHTGGGSCAPQCWPPPARLRDLLYGFTISFTASLTTSFTTSFTTEQVVEAGVRLLCLLLIWWRCVCVVN